jgi:hypothetical protein
MTSYTSQKTKIFTAKSFRDSFRDSVNKKIGYIFLSKSSEYPTENVVPELEDTVQQEKEIWDNMILAKRIIPKDVEMVIPRVDWIPGFRYKQYDDTLPLEDLLTISYDGDVPVYPMYVINSQGDVYKCLCNNVSDISFVEPLGTYTENDGFIQTDQNYLWKYMYSVRPSNKFLTKDWMPVPYIQTGTQFTDYNYSETNLVDGSLSKIVVTNRGTGYFHTTLSVAPFSAGSNTLTIIDNINLLTSDHIKLNMSVSGPGILNGETFISNVDLDQPTKLFLSQNTIGSGGGASLENKINITTRVLIEGDGTPVTTSVRLDGNNGVEKIDVINYGVNYNKANITIFGSGTNADARVVLPPKFGHGYNPAIELGATNVMVLSRIGEIDATENQIIPVDIEFRQYGLLTNAYKYENDSLITDDNSIDVVSQTHDLELLSPTEFSVDEMVYQGNIQNPDFIGYIVYQEGNLIKLNNVYKTPTVGSLIFGSTSGAQTIVISYNPPDLKAYAGDILYGKNILKVQRSLAQSEEIKLVFQF